MTINKKVIRVEVIIFIMFCFISAQDAHFTGICMKTHQPLYLLQTIYT